MALLSTKAKQNLFVLGCSEGPCTLAGAYASTVKDEKQSNKGGN